MADRADPTKTVPCDNNDAGVSVRSALSDSKMYEASGTNTLLLKPPEDDHRPPHLPKNISSRFHIKSSKAATTDFQINEEFFRDTLEAFYKKSRKQLHIKKAVYNFLEFPTTLVSIIYHIFTYFLFCLSITFTVLYTHDGYDDHNTLFSEMLVLLIVIVELGLRVWSCDVKITYRTNGRFHYLRTFPGIIDISIIILFISQFIAIYLVPQTKQNDKPILLLRAINIIKLLHYERFMSSIKVMGRNIWHHRREIASSYLIITYMLITVSLLIYVIEIEDTDSKISSLPDSLYFAVISFTTIGFGDIHPVTPLGKLLIAVTSFLGTALVALPAGIIASGFAIQLSQEIERKRKENNFKPAATFIQNVWRRHSILTKGHSSKSYKRFYVMLASRSMAFVPVDDAKKTTTNTKVSGMSTPTVAGTYKLEMVDTENHTATISQSNKGKNETIQAHISKLACTLSFLILLTTQVALVNAPLLKDIRKGSTQSDATIQEIHQMTSSICSELDKLKRFVSGFVKRGNLPNAAKSFQEKAYFGKKKMSHKSTVNNARIGLIENRLAALENGIHTIINELHILQEYNRKPENV